MTIRTRLKVFLIAVIAVPLFCVLFLPVYHFATRPERMLMSGYKQFRRLGKLPMSKRDIDVLKQVMRTLPPRVEFLLVADHRDILMTNFQEFKDKKEIDDDTLFDFMNETSQTYFYQLVSPPLLDAEAMIISRVNRDDARSRRKNEAKKIIVVIALISIFEAFAIAIVVSISRSISRSILFLEKSTEKIALGELDVSIVQNNSGKENEISHLSQNLDKMRLALKDSEERRAKFIMGISHDLRTPIAVIKGYTDAVMDGMYESFEEIKKPIEIIASKTEQLEAMVETLINSVKLNKTDWHGTLQNHAIAPLLSNFCESAITTGKIFKRNMETSVQIRDDLFLKIDPLLIQRALENILSNAIRYSSDGDLIRIRAFEEDKKLKILIEDTGMGIDKKDIAHIFDMFYRGDGARREGGIGMGLNVVKTVLDIHGWQVEVNSQKGVGTTFLITAKIE